MFGKEDIRDFLLIIVAVIIARGMVFEPYRIPSGSMYPTLQEGDIVVGSKLSYGFRIPFTFNMLFQYRPVKRGDVVIFTRPDDPLSPLNENWTNFVKRVIALPGEEVEVRNTKVFINNVELKEPYAKYFKGGLYDFPKTRVPEGKIFLLGDNRDDSTDSRFWPYTFLDISRVRGKVVFVLFSLSDFDRRFILVK
ncbi:MAG: signal peptidase I [Deltaproteobacteria bacterium]|nr:signal peptidase I [Deltaproteobacteria bacterium]